MKNNRFSRLYKAMKMELREHRSSFLVYLVLRLLVIIMMILQLLNQNYENVFLCVLTLLLFVIPSFIKVSFKIELPTVLEIVILVFIFSAEILGEISSYYLKFPFWDTILHTINGFLAAAIGFSLVIILNRNEELKFDLSPLFMAIVAFCFSMTVGVIWEFFEFGMDTFLGLDMQKDTIIHTINTVTLDPTRSNTVVAINNISEVMVNGQELGLGGYLDIGLIDTMIDLLVNFVGALIFSIFGFFYLKSGATGKFVPSFIPTMRTEEVDFLEIAQAESQLKEMEPQDEKSE